MAQPEAQAKPWEALGVSRRTWYRRKAEQRDAAAKPKPSAKPRVSGDLNVAAALASEPPAEIDGVAQTHARIAIESLVKALTFGASEAAKIAAAKEILDRGYGKPTVEIGGDGAMLPFMMAPAAIQTISLTAEIRAEARRYANLAIVVLHKIAEHGATESAVVSASRALLDRGLGTVGKARMPDEQRDQPLGKKEQAQRAADAAAAGLYAPRQPPRDPDRMQ